MGIKHNWYIPIPSLFPLLLPIALYINWLRRHEYIQIDKRILATRQREQERVRALGRREMEDGERNETRYLNECRAPLYMKR